MNPRTSIAMATILALTLGACSQTEHSGTHDEETTAASTTASETSPHETTEPSPEETTETPASSPSATEASSVAPSPTEAPSAPSDLKAHPFAHDLTIHLAPNWMLEKPTAKIDGTQVKRIVFREKPTDSITIFYVTPVMESSAAAVCGTLNRSLMKELTDVKEHGPETLLLGDGVDGILCGATGTNKKGIRYDYMYTVAQKKSSTDPKSGLLVWQYSRFAVKGNNEVQGMQAGDALNDLVAQVRAAVK